MGNLIPAGNDDPTLSPDQQRRALRILNDVNRHVQTMRRFEARLNTMHLFKGFVHPQGQPLSKSEVTYKDHPLVQLLLERRDRYDRMEEQIAQYQAVVDDFSPDGKSEQALKVNAIIHLAKLKMQQSDELEAMESNLIALRKMTTVHLHTCQKFITDIVKISQYERLLRQKAGTNAEDLSDEALDAQIEKVTGE